MSFSYSGVPGWNNYISIDVVEGTVPPSPKLGEKTETVDIEFAPLNATKIKSPFSYAPLPPEFLGFLGQIAVLWGQYEALLNELIIMLSGHNGSALEQNWQRRLSYEQRSKRFDDEAKKVFEFFPLIYLHLKQVIADAMGVQTKRNVLLHGTVHLSALVHNNNNTTELQTELMLVVAGRQKGEDIELTFDLEQLEDLFYEMGYLVGRLNTFRPNVPGHLPDLPYASWQDIYLVQDLLRKHHPAYTK